MVVPVPPLHPPARDNAARGCAGGTRLRGRKDNTNLQVRLLQETKGRAVFPLLSGEVRTEPTWGPLQCQAQGSLWLHREHLRDSDILPLRSDRAAEVT